MIYVKVCDEDQVYLFGVDNVEVGEGLHSLLSRMDATVHEHLAPLALNVDARTADFVA